MSEDVTAQSYADATTATFTYDAHHNELTATNAQGTTTFTYDTADHLTSVTYPSLLSLQYTYDGAGRRRQITDGKGYTANYDYDENGRLTRVTDASHNLIVSYAYNAIGLLARVDQANGTSSTYTYDANEEIQEVLNSKADGSVLSMFSYTRDVNGYPITMTTLDGTTSYAYDAAGRLTSSTSSDGHSLSFTYDAAGNRISTTVDGTTNAYHTNVLNAYVSAGSTTYTYTPRGELATKTDATGTTSYGYNAQGKLTTVVSPSAGSFTYLYDATGARIATIHDGKRVDELYDPTGDGFLVGRNDGKTVVDRFVYGLGLAARLDASGAASAYSFDALGNTADLTSADGSVVNQYAYLPFGETTRSTGPANNPFTFVGAFGLTTDGSGLAWVRNRAYDPQAGRFTSPDPSGITGGLNLYTYANNAPTVFIDVTGLQLQRPPVKPPPPAPEQANGMVLLNTGMFNRSKATLDMSTNTNNDPNKAISDENINRAETGNRQIVQGKKPALKAVGDIVPTGATKLKDVRNAGKVIYDGARGGGLIPPKNPTPIVKSRITLGKKKVTQRSSKDPNEIAGPVGVGAQGFVQGNEPLPYTIFFENQPTASAAAGVVTITENLRAEPRLEHVHARRDRIRGDPSRRARGSLGVQDAGRCPRHAGSTRRRGRAVLNPTTGVVRWTLTALIRKPWTSPPTPHSACCLRTTRPGVERGPFLTRFKPSRGSSPARASRRRRASCSTTTPRSTRRRSPTPSTPWRRRLP